MQILWCRTDPWLADPSAARRFCEGLLTGGLLTGGPLTGGLSNGDFLTPADLALHGAGRYLLLEGLRRSGWVASLGDLAWTANGKPYLPRVCFSISHAGAVALCALSDEAVGADVEETGPPDPLLLPALRPEERAYLEALPECRRASAFCQLWTRKESLLKARGGVLADLLDQESVVTAQGTWRDRVDGFFLRRIPLPEAGYEAAVCAEETGPLSPVRLELPVSATPTEG